MHAATMVSTLQGDPESSDMQQLPTGSSAAPSAMPQPSLRGTWSGPTDVVHPQPPEAGDPTYVEETLPPPLRKVSAGSWHAGRRWCNQQGTGKIFKNERPFQHLQQSSQITLISGMRQSIASEAAGSNCSSSSSFEGLTRHPKPT